ncbi:unnamed protein product [Blumeria hordei]|uniref:Uncharacterized protein n=1 Tax=Blumeria hordei TaxID=2867405 RepID=A0A383V198_BLUHO|nr:unnamed protein product [Blumeria hordei]
MSISLPTLAGVKKRRVMPENLVEPGRWQALNMPEVISKIFNLQNSPCRLKERCEPLVGNQTYV